MGKAGRVAGWVLGGLALLVLAGFALLQTGPAKRLLADSLNLWLAGPDSAITVGKIDGLVPLDFSVSRITLADKNGAWLTIDRAALKWSPSALLRGTARIDRLTAQSIDIARLPAASDAPNASTGSTGFSLPRLPVAVDLRDLHVARLAVSPALAGGDHAEAAVAAHGTLMRDSAALVLNLARTDGQKGAGLVDARYDQAANAITLKVDIDEPTGVAMDALTGRTDHLPLRVTLDGAGPLSGWAGKLKVLSGGGIGADAMLQIAHTAGTRVAVAGAASFAPLLAENARPMIGERVTFSVTGAEDGKGGLMLAPSQIALAAVTLNVEGGKSDSGALNGKMHIAVPNAASVGALAGQTAAGAISLDAALSGTVDRPKLALTEQGQLVFGQISVEGLAINAAVDSLSGPDDKDPRFGLKVDAKAAELRAADEGGKSYGALDVHFAGTTDTAGQLISVRELTAHGGGVDLNGDGDFKNGAGGGTATVTVTDLAVLGKLLDRPLGGSLTADITARTGPDKTVSAEVKGTADRLRTGIAAADALLAGPVRLSASGTGVPGGKINVSALSVESGRARLDAAGGFDPADRSVSATSTVTLTDLKALSAALASPLAGSGKLSATVGGTLDAPALNASATLDHLAFQAIRVDHLDATVSAPRGLSGAAKIDAKIASGKLNETLAAEVNQESDQAYRLSNLRLSGTGGNVSGNALVDLPRHMILGKLDGAADDLSVWSSVAGQAVSGRLSVALDLPQGRQGPVKLTVDRFTYGAGANSIGVGHAMLSGTASGDFARPAATFDLALGGVSAGGAAITQATAHVSAARNAEDFRLSANGHFQEAIAVEIAGTASQNRGSNNVRLSRLVASLGGNHLALEQAALLTIAPGAYAVTGLNLDIDGGKLSGGAALSPRAVSADLTLRQLPLHPIAFLAGKEKVGGTLDGRLTLAGTTGVPDAHLSLTTTGLDLETDGPLPRPKLSVSADAGWRGNRADLTARVSSASGEKLTISGSAPFAFDLATFKPLPSRDTALAVNVDGGGRLENLTSIVPLGEDRVTGAFSIDVAVGGTVEAPNPSGRIAITGGHYANMALGTELDGIDLAIDGQGERFVLDHLTATDAKSGKLNASGAVDLSAKPATVALKLGFTDFLVAQSDDATVDADGDLEVGGDLDAMKASGKFTVRHAELYIPDRLPASVVNLNVVEIGGGRQAAPKASKAKPAAPIALQIALDAPGQIFVRGHGITSEWRSHVDISGTTAAPRLLGQLEVVNGTINLLGQNFTIDRGVVRLDGGIAVDPVLDVQASATAGSLTATVNVTGTARAPKVALSSIPVLPQDEILAQVLFGSNVSSLTASQGLQLAAAAASLAQGGPGVLDKVRSKIGLDRLDLGSGGSNPNGTQGTAKGTTVTGGKYIASGVMVGVSQGITSNSSAALVQVEITPHISVNSTFGTASGSGFGAKYSIDY